MYSKIATFIGFVESNDTTDFFQLQFHFGIQTSTGGSGWSSTYHNTACALACTPSSVHSDACYLSLGQSCDMECYALPIGNQEQSLSLPINPSACSSTCTYCNTNNGNPNGPFPNREGYMQFLVNLANSVTTAPKYGFTAAVVNQTTGLVVATGINIGVGHQPFGHGEMLAVINFTTLFPNIQTPFNGFSLYTTGESCPMCMSTLLYSGFSEIVYGTSIMQLIDYGWPQINIPTYALTQGQVYGRCPSGAPWPFGTTYPCIFGNVLSSATNPLFSPQVNPIFQFGFC